jgi:hypothetical protein
MMAGQSTSHYALGKKLDDSISRHLETRGMPCTSCRDGKRLKIGENRLFPDVFVSCGKPSIDSQTQDIADAVVAVEILSRSTEKYDRGQKWLKYQTIPQLEHYVLVAQDKMRVEIFSRDGQGGWRYQKLDMPDARLELASIGYSITLGDLYSIVPSLSPGAPVQEATVQEPIVSFTPAHVLKIAALVGIPIDEIQKDLIYEFDESTCASAIQALLTYRGLPAHFPWIDLTSQTPTPD